jgi:glycosyltransferase involved in cell wall biosynthesis
MKCLHFITLANPFGEESGGQLRAWHVLKALERLLPVKLLLADCWSAPEEIAAARAAFPGVRVLHVEERPERNAIQFLRRNLTRYAHRSYRYVCREKEDVLRSFAADDLVWSFGLKAAACIGLNGRRHRTFVDVDDLPSQMMALERPDMKGWIRRRLFRGKVRQWRMRERRLARTYAGVGVCSEADRRYLGGHPSIHVIPNGFSAPEREPLHRPSDPPRIGFIGNLRYEPNVQGMSWFIREVWPRVKAAVPAARLRLVGIGNGGAGTPGVDVDRLGYLEDPAEEIASWAMLIVPIFVGGGTRIKIADAFSRKCPVVSTPRGAYGHEISHGRELLLAESPADFAAQCVRVIAKPEEAQQRAEAAYSKFLRDMTWEVTARRVEAAVSATLLDNRRGEGRRALATA